MPVVRYVLLWVAIIFTSLLLYMGITGYPVILFIVGCIAYYYLRIKKAERSWQKNSPVYTWIQNNRETTINAALATGTITICLLIFEFYLHSDIKLQSYQERNNIGSGYSSAWYHNDKGWLHIYSPNENMAWDEKEFYVPYKTNSIGFNDKERSTTKDSAVRLITFGDSFTEGVGSLHDSTYSNILQSILPHTEVMKCGVIGSDPVFDFKLLQQKILAYHPDIVTFAINQSDINDVIHRGGFERFLPNGKFKGRSGPWWEPFFAHLYIVRFIVIKVLYMDFSFFTYRQKIAEETKAVATLQSCTDSIQALCRQNHIRCIFVFHPMANEAQQGKMDCNPVMQYAADHGCETVDVLAWFKTHGVNATNYQNYYWPFDGHNNNNGYILFAEAIREQVLKPAHQASLTGQAR